MAEQKGRALLMVFVDMDPECLPDWLFVDSGVVALTMPYNPIFVAISL